MATRRFSTLNSFIKPDSNNTPVRGICEPVKGFTSRGSKAKDGCSHVKTLLRGYPAWIRTKNNASKGRCVTVTPRGTRIYGLDSQISPRAQFPKCIRVTAGTQGFQIGDPEITLSRTQTAEQLAAEITVE